MAQKSELNYTAIIVAIIIAGALIFVGMQLGTKNAGSDASFEEQMDAYIKKQQDEQRAAQGDEQKQKEALAKTVRVISEDDHIQGSRDAEITIYEYSDFECPYCKHFYKTPGQIVANNDGKVNAVYRHFPIEFHDPLATTEAVAAECAAEQGGDVAFYKMHDAIFDATTSNGKGLKEGQLAVIAQQIGLDQARFNTCLASGKYDDHIAENIQSGADAGVTGTPSVIVKNNKTGEVRVLPGFVAPEVVQAAVDELLAK